MYASPCFGPEFIARRVAAKTGQEARMRDASAALLRRAGVDLLVGGLGDLLQPVALGRPADHVGEVAVDPVERRRCCRPRCSAAPSPGRAVWAQ